MKLPRCLQMNLSTSYAYKKGCRCEDCRLWKRDAEAPRAERAKETSRLWRLQNPARSRAGGKKWAADNPDKALNAYLKRTYGITLEAYKELLAKQNNGCAICEKEEAGRRFSVDHDHRTGRVRGLLCSNCNTSLGGFKDSPELLQAAIEYVTY